MFGEIHEPLHITMKHGMKTEDRLIAICSNKTIAFLSSTNKSLLKRTGCILNVTTAEKTSVNITYEKRVRRAGAGPKAVKVTFDSTSALDHFLAAYASIKTRSTTMQEHARGERTMVSVMINTWNVGDQDPNSSFYEFLKRTTTADQPDVVIFSGQETPKDDTIFANISKALEENYVQVVGRDFWQIRCGIFVTKRIQGAVSDVYASHEATGVFGVMGNKGAIGAAITVFGSPIAVVASHLAAHQSKVNERNEDFHTIISNIQLGLTAPHNIMSSFHHVIWAGDLNYRIDQPFAEVKKAVDEGRLADLWPYDQLRAQMEAGNVFPGFVEGKIDFAPTYKFKRNTNNYDEGQGRIPSWCDRVLIRSFENLQRRNLKYEHVRDVNGSDHHPVYALWNLEVVMTTPPPPPFAAAIGVKPYLEFANLIYNSDSTIPSVSIEFEAPFLTKKTGTATGRGRHSVQFPDETVPLLIPESTIDVQYMRTLYIYIIVRLSESLAGICHLPLDFALVDVFRPFTLDVMNGLDKIGSVSGSVRIIPANEGVTQEQKARHHKADPRHQFETRFARQ